MSRALDVDGPLGRFAERLLRIELPELPPDRLADAVEFVCRRAKSIPGPLRMGVTAIAVGVDASRRVVDPARSTEVMRGTSIPLLGELARMVRSLAFTFVWESWPETAPDGSRENVR